nr:hypothetical protein [Tanacetum cinerariifolium]
MTEKYFVEYTGIEVKHFRDTLLQHMGNVKKSIFKRARHQRQYDRRVNKTLMQMQESKIDMGKAVNDNLVVTESSGTESKVQDDNSMSGNDTDADNTDIRPIYDEEPMAKVQLTTECNIFAIGQQHTEQPKIINEDQALKSGQHGQVLNDESNKAKIKKEIDVLETINIELEHKVANFSKENETLKKHYKDLYDFIKITRSRTIEQTTSLLANNADLKAQIQEKEVNSRVKIQSHKTRDRNKPVDQKSHTQIPGRQIFTGHKFSPNKTSAVYEKISHRSDLRWQSTGRIFKSVGLRWLPTGKNHCQSGFTNDEIMMASDQNSSDPAPECQTMALNHDSLSLAIQRQEKVTQADRTVTTSNELDLLFSSMFDELLNGSSKVMSKSSAVSAADAPNQRQQLTTPLTNHTTPAPTCQIPTLVPTVISSESINQAETYAENDQFADDEFINIFSNPVQDQGDTSSRYVDSSNMHTFYQRYPSEHRWTKDHPLEQVIGNPSQSVRTRRQLESDAGMCMFALT